MNNEGNSTNNTRHITEEVRNVLNMNEPTDEQENK